MLFMVPVVLEATEMDDVADDGPVSATSAIGGRADMPFWRLDFRF